MADVQESNIGAVGIEACQPVVDFHIGLEFFNGFGCCGDMPVMDVAGQDTDQKNV